jgi:dienelactone hydrolase
MRLEEAVIDRLIVGIIAAALISFPVRAQSPAPEDLPARIEIHPFQTLTISDSQFLAGDDKGKEVTLTGELSIAQGSGRLRLVVLMHGSGGIGGNISYWKRQLNGMGVSTFMIDGFTGRGLARVGDSQALLGRLNFILDIYRSLDILAKHPRVDPERMILMGFSRGGQAALYASVERFQKMWNKSGVELAAYISFYPDCATTYRQDVEVAKRPIRIFHGAPDNYNPVRTCKVFVERLKQAGADVQLTEYPNAAHGFDNPLAANPPTPTEADQSVRECTIRENENAVLINEATKAPFTYKDECVRIGPTIGADPEALQAATVAVTDFVRSVITAR